MQVIIIVFGLAMLALVLIAAYSPFNKSIKITPKCPICGSLKVRGYDNEPLYSPTLADVSRGVSPIDKQLVVNVCCDSCKHKFNITYNLVIDSIQ